MIIERKSKLSEISNREKELEQLRKDIAIKKKEEIKKIMDKLQNDLHDQLEKELVRKQKLIRNQLKTEYDLNLKRKIHEPEEELNRKKLDLEFELQNKMKSVLS